MESPAVSFRVAKEDLAGAVGWVARSLPSKPAQPVLRGMVITADEDGLELAGFDYEKSAVVRIPAQVVEPGRFVVGGKLIADITSTLPNKEVEISLEGSSAILQCGSSRFELPLLSLEDYPQLPQLPAETASIDAHLFMEAVSQVAIAAGRDDTLPMLTGVHMDISGNTLRLVATDRFRLAVRNLEWEAQNQQVNAKLLIPAKTLLDNAKTLSSNVADPLTIAAGDGAEIGRDGLFGLHSGNRRSTTRMLDADFPSIEPLLPKTHTSIASVDIATLTDAIRRVSLIADRSGQIRMEFSEGQLILSASGTDAGHAEEVIECAFAGEPLMIAFNPSFLKDGLSVIHTDRAVFGFTQPSRPAIVVPEPEELPQAGEDGTFPTPNTDFLYLLMPVRLPG